MQLMKPKNFDYLNDVKWFNQVSEMKVTLHEVGSNAGRSTTMTLFPELHQSVYNILEGEGIIKASAEIEEEIHTRIQHQVEKFIERRIDKYKKGIKIHNQLVDLNVKDKRASSCGEKFEGKIKPKEMVSNLDSLENIAHVNTATFRVTFPCPYDYDWSSNAKQRYIYNKEKCIVKERHPNLQMQTCDLELELTFRYATTPQVTDEKVLNVSKEKTDEVLEQFKVRFDVPNPKLYYNLTDHANQIKQVCMMNACDVESKWNRKTGTHKDTLKFNSRHVNWEYRKVGLNTFIIYCREKSDSNRNGFLQQVKESVNEQEMMKELETKFGEENISKTQGYRSDINFNHNSYWGRYSTSVVKVMLSDKSFLYYDFNNMVRNRTLDLLGLYDSTYKKETTKSAYERVMANNNQDTFARYDFEEMNRKNK